MQFTPRDYQIAFETDALAFFSTAQPGHKRLYAAPTGTGKSLMELSLQAKLGEGAWILTPRVEIIAGMMQKLGVDVPDSENALIQAAAALRITTPLRLRNTLLRGSASEPRQLIFDEGHHDLAATWQDIHPLCGYAPAVALTATPFRGTPKGTAAFREQWGEPVYVLTYPEAAERGVIAIPSAATWPLVDDDEIEVVNGELVATRVCAATASKLDDAASRIVEYYDRFWDKPTMISLPSRELAHQMADRLRQLGAGAVAVDGNTSHGDRQLAFAHCINRVCAICQIDVVSEGVDLPLRRLVDLRPTLSPVKWLQQLGRITRPGGESEYICCNRNLMRHGYLLEGCLPPAVIAASQKEFGGPSKRAVSRAVGLESVSRFKSSGVELASGLVATVFSLSAVDGYNRTDYFGIVHPAKEDVIWAKATHSKDSFGNYAWGKWQPCGAPDDLRGFASASGKAPSDKQKVWWESSAKRFGLAPDAEITRHNFGILPVLSDLRMRLT